MDVHEPTSTVKEALIFSSILRQPASVPREEKLAYVDHIINLLELEDITEALIGGEFPSLADIGTANTNGPSSW